MYKLTQDGGKRWQSTDLNNSTNEGFYYASGSALNIPISGRSYMVDVKNNVGEFITDILQVAYESSTSVTNMYFRRYSTAGGTWNSWVKIPLPSEVQLGKVFTDSGKTLSLTSPDLDALTQSGFFYVTQSTNGPSVEFGVTTNGFLDVLVRDHSNVQVKQIFTTFDSSRIFTRINNTGVWTRWKELSALTATTEYTDITLINGTTAYSGSGYNPQFAKVGNQVYIRGEVKSDFSLGRIIGYLPAGYRPSQKHRFVQSTFVTTPQQEIDRWSIDTNGAIRLDGTWGQDGAITDAYALHTSFLI
ncbi:pyocin knob domain-containing protein [Exiguobacterium antarcticum]|uniref:pyocin knob domain-containing protein n=1 Tax=Exiguobacterium antarcticum TaxID=132920 RepID=UPI001F47116F|nr:pyocin knob domain-containing protein [Exiguobacterium antarcticum]